MPDTEHTYLAELFDPDGGLLGQGTVEPDWFTAIEAAHFAAIRAGEMPPVSTHPACEIRPVWHADRGQPYVEGIEIELAGAGAGPYPAPASIFEPSVQTLADSWVEQGRLEKGQHYRAVVSAYPHRVDDIPNEDSESAFVVEDDPQPLNISSTAIATLTTNAVPFGEPERDDCRVLVTRALIRETMHAARAANGMETGGALIGRLHRDTNDGDLFLEITTQIPAAHTIQDRMSLTFTHETWSAVHGAIHLRGLDEMLVGWWHTHPDWCRECAPDRQETCPLQGVFFSATDVALHRAVFPRAHHVALLLTDRPNGVIPSMFGWRRGVVAPRAFEILGARTGEPDGDVGDETLDTPFPVVIPTVGGQEKHQ